jgi:tetratricopeptide (TPR) repeat protein
VAERGARWLTAFATLAAFATAFAAAFQFDDFHLVVDNPGVHSWGAWAASMPGIRPLAKASLTLSWTLWPAPASFAAFSLACHVASALLVLALARSWLPSLAPACPRPGFAALVAALAFALHPAQTEAVTYVAARPVALAGVLYLGAMLAAERGRAAWSAALFVLALAARETAWTLPFALVLIDAARGNPWRTAFRRAAPQFSVLALAVVAMAASPVYRRLLATSLEFRPPLANLLAQVDAVAYYVTRPLLMLRVVFDPGQVARESVDATWWFAATAIVAAIAVGFAQLKRRPWVGVAILWFFLQLVPANGPIARYDLVNDRQLYLALIGPALAAGVALAHVGSARAGTIAATALAVLLGTATFVRNLDYRSEVALWEATVRAAPGNARAWNNLGYAWRQKGEFGRARAAYLRALDADPSYAKARANLNALPAP